MDKKNQKTPLKSALKKTKPAQTTPVSAATTKRKYTEAPSTSATNGAKRVKPSTGGKKPDQKQQQKSKNNNTKSQQQKQNNTNSQKKKSVTIGAPHKKGTSVTSGSTPAAAAAKKVVKPKKVEVVPEGASVEDLRIVAGTYENILYGVDAYWNDDMTLRLSPIFIFAAHIGCIKSLAIGGNFLASGSTDEKIQLYDLKRRKELGNLLQHQGTITSLTFHNKTHMLSGSDDGKVCVWRSKDWECLKSMKGHQASVHSIAIHPSGKIALSVSADHSVRLWNLLLGKQASMTRLHGEGMKVCWNPSGTGYAILFDQEVGIYDMATAKCVLTIKPAKRTRLNSMTYYKDEYLIVGCEDKMVRVYKTATGELIKTLAGHGNRIKDVALVTVPFTPEQKSNKAFVNKSSTKMVDVLTSVSSDGVILLWNMEEVIAPKTAAEDQILKKHIGEHKTDMRVTCLAVQKGIWKNVNCDAVTGSEEEDEDSDEEEALGGAGEAQDSEDEDEDEEEDDEDDE
ncbi:p21-activated protein kinase-interacting protein 1-like protein [Gryganskiella cystojenkinii]|nr:p21-activated protein kinase-interacting protein 1-like protein [Gryganskiella cystojenkinii]